MTGSLILSNIAYNVFSWASIEENAKNESGLRVENTKKLLSKKSILSEKMCWLRLPKKIGELMFFDI